MLVLQLAAVEHISELWTEYGKQLLEGSLCFGGNRKQNIEKEWNLCGLMMRICSLKGVFVLVFYQLRVYFVFKKMGYEKCVEQVALCRRKVIKMFGLVHIVMPLHARKPYPKPWLQHIRGSDGERSLKIFSSEKKQSPRHGGEML